MTTKRQKAPDRMERIKPTASRGELVPVTPKRLIAPWRWRLKAMGKYGIGAALAVALGFNLWHSGAPALVYPVSPPTPSITPIESEVSVITGGRTCMYTKFTLEAVTSQVLLFKDIARSVRICLENAHKAQTAHKTSIRPRPLIKN